MLFPYFVYIAHFTKFTRGSSVLKEKSLLMEKSKVFGKRKGKKKQAQRRKKEYHSVKKRKNCLVIAIGTDVAPR